MKKSILIVALFVMLPAAVFAQEADDTSETTFKAGAGVSFIRSPYRGDDGDVVPFPLIMYKKGKFAIFGTQLTYDVFENDGWVFQGIGKWRSEGYDEDDSRQLRGMGDRDQTFEIGVGVKKNFGYSTFNTTFTNDLFGKHNGNEVRIFFNKNFKDALYIKDLTMTPAIGVNIRNKNLNNYYYGVRAKEATATRAYYKAGSSENLFTGLSMNYPMSEKWELFCSLDVEWLSSEIRSSPIVSGDYLMSLFIGAMYSF